MYFQQALDGEFYNLDKAVKIVYEKDIYKITFEVPVRLGKNKSDTYIQKKFKNLEIPEQFTKIDSNLYLDLNKILKVTFYNNYCYLTSNTKKKVGSKYINYNIKASHKNKEIMEKLKGDKMWIQIGNSFVNLNKVTNIFIDEKFNKIIINFINSSTNMERVEDIKPEFEVEFFNSKDKLNNFIQNILKMENWIQINEKLINLDNVYNVKVLPIQDKFIIFINFISNITKQKGKEKIISTEFVKYETDNKEELERLLKNLKIIKE
jgi:hypothetical protein